VGGHHREHFREPMGSDSPTWVLQQGLVGIAYSLVPQENIEVFLILALL
jgi:hypothetical protein